MIAIKHRSIIAQVHDYPVIKVLWGNTIINSTINFNIGSLLKILSLSQDCIRVSNAILLN
jgi:hypothetical protein